MNLYFLILSINIISWVISQNNNQINEMSWYQQNKSAVTPPGYIFSMVWITLYSLIAIVLYRIWLRNDSIIRKANLVLIISLIVISYAFTPLFVNREFLWSNTVILICLLLSILLIVSLSNYDQLSSLLMVPWSVWLIQALIFSSHFG